MLHFPGYNTNEDNGNAVPIPNVDKAKVAFKNVITVIFNKN